MGLRDLFRRWWGKPAPPEPAPENDDGRTVTIFLSRDEVFRAVADEARARLNVADQHHTTSWQTKLRYEPGRQRVAHAEVDFTINVSKPRAGHLRVVSDQPGGSPS